MEFPDPVISVAVEPKSVADQEKPAIALVAHLEDPSFRVETDKETGQMIISGMGGVRSEVMLSRMQRESALRRISISPKWRIERPYGPLWSTKFIRQTGGRGQYGHVKFT